MLANIVKIRNDEYRNYTLTSQKVISLFNFQNSCLPKTLRVLSILKLWLETCQTCINLCASLQAVVCVPLSIELKLILMDCLVWVGGLCPYLWQHFGTTGIICKLRKLSRWLPTDSLQKQWWVFVAHGRYLDWMSFCYCTLLAMELNLLYAHIHVFWLNIVVLYNWCFNMRTNDTSTSL